MKLLVVNGFRNVVWNDNYLLLLNDKDKKPFSCCLTERFKTVLRFALGIAAASFFVHKGTKKI
ncbi:hypothetical protein PW52_11530 [Tamlana sedimentorum]|uniref:Uncharacterized protein n=1 Tax=Neotamlana sedimentorum TaxID=1435349 RepID=A0A0D7W8C3_9FLAO|nr:hypothetical protein PW52_11530 [Tamlana sedimentorum]